MRLLEQENIIVSAQPLPAHCLRIEYKDGDSYTIDFSGRIESSGALSPLADPQVFCAARITDEGRLIEFPGGIDFCADALRVDGELSAALAV